MRTHPSVSHVSHWFWAAVTFLAFGLGMVCFGQEATPETPPATDSGFNFATLVALVGAIVVIARVIVKLTPTPKDDTVMEKVVEWLKHLGLVIKCLVLVSLIGLSTGCAGRTTAQVVRALSKDPASVHVRITSIYGTIEVARTNPGTNTPPLSIGENGAIKVK